MITTIEELDAKLREFETLPDNWDSYGAEAVSTAITARARAIYELLRPTVCYVCPGGDNLVEISMASGKRRLSITVEASPPDEEDVYALYNVDSHEIDELASVNIPRIQELIAEMGLRV